MPATLIPPQVEGVQDCTTARILITGAQPIFRDGLKRLLETDQGLQVIGEAGDGASTMQLVRQLKPDLLLFDLGMRDAGLDVLRALAATSKLPRTIVLASSIAARFSMVSTPLAPFARSRYSLALG